MNPLKAEQMKIACKKHDKDEYYCIWCFKKPKDDSKDIDLRPWSDSLIIDLDNRVYLCFNGFVSALCLLSSYYYGAHVCFRYSDDVDPHAGSRRQIEIAIEIIFAAHLMT